MEPFQKTLARNIERAERVLRAADPNNPNLRATIESVRGYLQDPRLRKLTADLADARDGTFSYTFFLEAIEALERATGE